MDSQDTQKILQSIRDDLPVHESEINVNYVLHGDVDLSVFYNLPFPQKITSIRFEQPGTITSLINIPSSVISIYCPNQQIVSVNWIPTNIHRLNLSNNALTTLDLSTYSKLEYLEVDNNNLTDIFNISSSLITLSCSNNQINLLDLQSANNLQELNITGNENIQLINLPINLKDISSDNVQDQEQDDLGSVESSDTDDVPEKRGGNSSLSKIDYVEGINEYYKFKQKYETSLMNLRKAAVSRAATHKEGLRKAKDVKAPCLGCGKKVGMVFSQDADMLTAVCGDNKGPCTFHIKLYRGNYATLDALLNLYETDIENDKTNIIIQKMDTLFTYLDEQTSTDIFKQRITSYNDTSSKYKELLGSYDNLYNDLDKESRLVRKLNDMYKTRDSIRTVINEYKKNGNREILTDAMEMYKTDFIPIILSIRALKYDNMFVEEHKPFSKLIQYDIAPHNTQILIGDERKVLKYNVTP